MAFNDEDIRVANKFKKLYNSAKKRNKEFSLTLGDVRKILRRKTCAYTGTVLTNPNGGTMKPTDRTVDRVDPDKGYHPENIVACCFLANNLKEMLLESKFRPDETPHPMSCEWSFLKKFVKSLDKIGYQE
ncbi:hypothetical protein N9937_00315 [bacterium]|nr:hypothetical protein [bacterium]